MPTAKLLAFPVSACSSQRKNAVIVVERIDPATRARMTHIVQLPPHLLEIARWLGQDAANILQYAVSVEPPR